MDNSVPAQADIAKGLGSEHRVRISPTFSNARQLLAAKEFDLLLLDTSLPGAGGNAAIRTIRQDMGIDTPILVLHEDMNPTTMALLRPWVSGFIKKGPQLDLRTQQEVARIFKG